MSHLFVDMHGRLIFDTGQHVYPVVGVVGDKEHLSIWVRPELQLGLLAFLCQA